MSSEKRESFIFYESFFQAIDKMGEVDQLPIYKAIAEYALYRKQPALEGMGSVIWSLIQPNLDANWNRWNNGRKGGAPQGNSNAVKTTENQPKTTKKQPNKDVDKDVNVDKDKENNNRTAKRFTPPSFGEVSEYITQKGYTINPQSFIDFYTSNGWRVGKNPMKDWKATIRSWSSRDDGNRASTVQTPQKTQQYDEL